MHEVETTFGRRTWAILLIGVLALGVVALSGIFLWHGRTSGAIKADVDLGKGFVAPDFSARTLDGETVRLSDYRGNPVVLNFFAGWCAPCKKEAPYLQAAYEKGDGDFALLGITFQDTEATARNFADNYGVTYPILLDDSEEVGKTYRIRSFPVTFFIRSDGVIHSVIKGPVTREFALVMLEGMAGL